jgi:protein-tyrosine phosphatase
MNYLLEKHGLQGQIVCDSAGTGGYHIGNPPDRRMNAAAQTKLGITLQGAARQFSRQDFEKFDLILAMDRENYQDILRLDREEKYSDKVRLMCEFCQKYPDEEVPDPYYGGTEGFNYVIDLLMDACSGLLHEIESRE